VFQTGPEVDKEYLPTIFNDIEHEKLESVRFPQETVYKKLIDLKPHSAPGADNITPLFLKACATEVSLPLSLIFEKSMEEGRLPPIWKKMNITPIHKGGRQEIPENYRPINVSSIPCKVKESIIKDALLLHLTQNELLLSSQHGFVPGRSCTTNLLMYLNEVTTALDAGIPYDVILLDFRRAFDVVPFEHMLSHLEAHGVGVQLLAWMRNWTEQRKQRVVLNGHCSDWADVISSVVQGSVLGPILFIIFINSMDFAIKDPNTNIFKYADDSKIGRHIRNEADAKTLQSSLDEVCKWDEKSGMQLHPAKSVVLHFGYNNPRHEYTIAGEPVSNSGVAKDLGVLVNEQCTPRDHVNKVIKKGNQILGQLKRTIISRDPIVFPRIFKTYVRPILETAAPAWCPLAKGEIERLEKVQRRATKLIPTISSKPYEERYTLCNLPTLEERRARGDMIQTFKILNGFTNIQPSKLFKFTKDRHELNTRNSATNALVPERSRLDIRKSFFANRIVEQWNDLPPDVRNAESVNHFKNSFDDYMTTLNCI